MLACSGGQGTRTGGRLRHTSDCCARAASGHANAPPCSDMNARRFTWRERGAADQERSGKPSEPKWAGLRRARLSVAIRCEPSPSSAHGERARMWMGRLPSPFLLFPVAGVMRQPQVFSDRVKLVRQFFNAVRAQKHGNVVKLYPNPFDVCQLVGHGGTLTSWAWRLARF